MNPNYTPQPGQPPQSPYGGNDSNSGNGNYGQPYQPSAAPYGPPASQPQPYYGQGQQAAQQPYAPQSSKDAPAIPYNRQYTGQYNNLPYRTIPYQPPVTRNKPASKKLVLVSGGLLMLFLIGVAVMTMNNDAPSEPTKTTIQEADPALADISSRPDGILDLSKKITVESSLKAQSIKAKSKEQINLSSGFSFLVGATGNYDSAATPPANGKKLVIVQIVAGNRADDNSDSLSVSYRDFKLQTDDNNLVNGHPSTQQIPDNILASPSALKSGEQVEGRIIYEVDAAATKATIVHKETYRKNSDGSSFTVEGLITVDL